MGRHRSCSLDAMNEKAELYLIIAASVLTTLAIFWMVTPK